MLVNPNPDVAIEISPNSFSKVKYLWLIANVFYKTIVTGYGFENDEELEKFKRGESSRYVIISFGIIDVKITDNLSEKIHNKIQEQYPDWQITL
jgi:hypothetical protein